MSPSDWKVRATTQPKPQGYRFDLDKALSSVLALSATVPSDAFTAETLGTERAGNAVLIREDGLVLTVGYLVTEAAAVWLTSGDGRVTPGHVIGVDGQTGLGLIQALAPLGLPALPLGSSAEALVGQRVVVAGAGGRRHSVAARITMKQEFAGYWEYVLDEAIFTAPAHPHWGGTALIAEDGRLIGIGSLQLQQERGPDHQEHLNMMVPIDLLKPVLDDLLRLGQPDRPPRPWLGLYATEIDGRVAVAGVARGGPADAAGLQLGDIVTGIAGQEVRDLAGFFRSVWALGPAGVEVPLKLHRDGRAFEARLASVDRRRLLKGPVMH
ncbi:S1C family serine protease [Enterovirga sp.]|uniref:S1C family serine protease n=1 Tax=Enterovirga sp. TaxID=2026350 RepID=UPI002618368E|nr:S1C family serine protease [Enterovirga sp.]MDB5590457.1 serine protease [Enterovirga sp.]